MKNFKSGVALLLVLLGLNFSGCLVLDGFGANPNAIKGDKARLRIIDAAIFADLVNVSGLGGIGILTVLSDKIAGIDPEKYYSKSDVEACETELNGITGIILDSLLTIVLLCDIQPDPLFIRVGPVDI